MTTTFLSNNALNWWFENTSTMKMMDENQYCDRYVIPEKIVFNGDHTHVFWKDGTRVSVKRMEGDTPDRKHAVASAIAIEIFGTRSKFNKFVDGGHVQPTKEEKKAAKDARKALKDAKENFEWPF